MHSQQDNGQRVRGLASIYVICVCVFESQEFFLILFHSFLFSLYRIYYICLFWSLFRWCSVCAHKFNYTSSVKSSVCETDRVYFILGFSCIFLFRHSVIKRASRYVDALIASARRPSIKHLSLFPLKFLIIAHLRYTRN